MASEPSNEPGPTEAQRLRLLRKIECLIAVLQAAKKKVDRSLRRGGCDAERLERIRVNLCDTMEVCLRARLALQGRAELPEELRERLARVANEPELRDMTVAGAGGLSGSLGLPPGARVELSSADEAERFRALGPIDAGMIAGCDLDELARRLTD